MADQRRARWRERTAPPHRMGGRPRLAVYSLFGFLWLTGCVWLVLNQFFQTSGPFGPSPHPWQPAVLLSHGIASVLGVYLLGWLSARHVFRWWPVRLRRLSGGTLSASFALLTLTGFALFFVSDDRWQRMWALSHDALGLLVTAFAVQHWFFARRRDIRSAASRPW